MAPARSAKSSSRPRDSRKSSPAREGRPLTRPIWTGQLRLALVSVPVMLVAATKSAARLALHQIHEPSGKRIKYDKVAPGVGSVEADEIRRGVEVSKGRYVVLADEELASLKIEARRTLDLVQFVASGEIEPIWYERPYFILPDGDMAEESYAVIRDALRATDKVGIGQFVMRGHDYVAALKPCGEGMVLETLRFADEVQSASKVFAGLDLPKPQKDLLELAGELINRKTAPFDPSAFHDRYAQALRRLIDARAKHQKLVEVEDEEPEGAGKVIDLVEALKRSVRPAGGAPSKQKGRIAAPTSKRRKAG